MKRVSGDQDVVVLTDGEVDYSLQQTGVYCLFCTAGMHTVHTCRSDTLKLPT